MNPVTERLMAERKKWRQDPAYGFTLSPTKNIDGKLNLFKWECDVPGPRKTAWEGSINRFSIEFDRSALRKPITEICLSKCFHPNVSSNGRICSSLTYNNWPDCSLKQILFSLQSFLEFPNVSYPSLNPEATNLYRHNRTEYDRRVRALKTL